MLQHIHTLSLSSRFDFADRYTFIF
jgi:hypothetical protein